MLIFLLFPVRKFDIESCIVNIWREVGGIILKEF